MPKRGNATAASVCAAQWRQLRRRWQCSADVDNDQTLRQRRAAANVQGGGAEVATDAGTDTLVGRTTDIGTATARPRDERLREPDQHIRTLPESDQSSSSRMNLGRQPAYDVVSNS